MARAGHSDAPTDPVGTGCLVAFILALDEAPAKEWAGLPADREKIMITIAGGIILAVVIVFVVAPVVLGLIGGAILRAVFWFADIGSDSQK
jgi:hypothetical protein